MINLKNKYNSEIKEILVSSFKYSNIHLIPKIISIHVSTNLGLNMTNKQISSKVLEDLKKITGQFPRVTLAKKSISNFKIRKGMPLGYSVTLRRHNMYNFLERLIHFALPQIRDFNGIYKTKIDKNLNISFGIKDYNIFPELINNLSMYHGGLQITISTTAKSREEVIKLLTLFNFPFTKN